MKHRIRVYQSPLLWRWECTCRDRGASLIQPVALAAGLAHLELWHNDPARRPA
jgi:hypothetical protein